MMSCDLCVEKDKNQVIQNSKSKTIFKLRSEEINKNTNTKTRNMQTVTSVSNRVIETVKPMVTTVVEKTAPVLTSAIEGTIR